MQGPANFIGNYLKRIGIENMVKPSSEGLFELHQSHVMTVPFENIDISNGTRIKLDLDYLYNKVVLKNRGGFCYELNYLFFTLLTKLGFNVRMTSASILDENGELGPSFDHMCLIVFINNSRWLVDVGFGDLFISPTLSS